MQTPEEFLADDERPTAEYEAVDLEIIAVMDIGDEAETSRWHDTDSTAVAHPVADKGASGV